MEKGKRVMQVLKAIEGLEVPAGAIFLSQYLEIPQGSMGRILSQLETDGFIEKVSNKGRRLTEKGRQHLLDNERRDIRMQSARELMELTEELSEEHLLQILEIRKLLECYAIPFTCERITDTQLEELNMLLLDNIYAVKKGGTGNQEDLRLHLAIARYSGNEIIYQILNLILTQKNAYVKFSSAAAPDEHFQVEEHKRIIEAIARRDGDAASTAMKQHIEKVAEDVKRFYRPK